MKKIVETFNGSRSRNSTGYASVFPETDLTPRPLPLREIHPFFELNPISDASHLRPSLSVRYWCSIPDKKPVILSTIYRFTGGSSDS